MPNQFQNITKPVIIMPFHFNSAVLYHALTANGVEVLGFWDNNEAINGESYDGKIIALPTSDAGDVTIIIYYKKYESEIRKQLSGLGYSDFISAQSFGSDSVNMHMKDVRDDDLYRIRPDYRDKHRRELWLDAETCVPITGERYGALFDNVPSGKRKILLLSHELTRTGAPIAMQQAARIFRKNGDTPIILSPTDGKLLEPLLCDRIPVIIDYKLPYNPCFSDFASCFDLIIVNTFTFRSISAIEQLNLIPVPVLWWIHEASSCYTDTLVSMMPSQINSNIQVCCVSERARDVFYSRVPGIPAKLLWFGIEDFYEDGNPVYLKKSKAGKLKFMIVGAVIHHKGHDVLCSAFRQMPSSVRSKCELIVVGPNAGPVFEDILELKRDYPDSVTITDEVDRDEVKRLLHQCDCMICASREETGPIVIVEGMMFHKICICSENTGVAALIKDGINGFVYSGNNPTRLCEKLTYVVEHFDELDDMREKSRAVYDEHFSLDVFGRNLLAIIDEITECYRRCK